MGERTAGMNGKQEEPAPKVQVRVVEGEIERVRIRLDQSLAELDRRRHELTDLRLQARQHPRVLLGVGLAVMAILAGMAYAIARRRRRFSARSASLSRGRSRRS